MQLCLQHYLIFLPPLPSMKIEPQPAKEQLLVVIQTIMPESSLRLGDMCLVFCVAPFIVKGSQNYPHWLPQDSASVLAWSWGMQKRHLFWSQTVANSAIAGSPAAGLIPLPLLHWTPLVADREPQLKLSSKICPPSLCHPTVKLCIHVTLRGPESCCLQYRNTGLERTSRVTTRY